MSTPSGGRPNTRLRPAFQQAAESLIVTSVAGLQSTALEAEVTQIQLIIFFPPRISRLALIRDRGPQTCFAAIRLFNGRTSRLTIMARSRCRLLLRCDD